MRIWKVFFWKVSLNSMLPHEIVCMELSNYLWRQLPNIFYFTFWTVPDWFMRCHESIEYVIQCLMMSIDQSPTLSALFQHQHQLIHDNPLFPDTVWFSSLSTLTSLGTRHQKYFLIHKLKNISQICVSFRDLALRVWKSKWRKSLRLRK